MGYLKKGFALGIFAILGACDTASLSSDLINNNDDLGDLTPPTSAVVAPLSGSNISDEPSVTLTLSATDAAEMSIVKDAVCAPNPSWEAFESTYELTLDNLDGYTSVSAKFRDDAGNESACVTTQILYSSTPCFGDRLSASIAKGDGSSSNPYIVCTADQFKGLSSLSLSGKYVELAADIDLAGETLTNFASLSNTVVDGKNHVVKNYVVTGGQQYGGAGLFQNAYNSVIMNFHVENYTVSSGNSYQVGGIVGSAYGSTLSNVSAKNGSVNHSGVWYGGSLVGNFCNSVIVNSWSDGDVTSSNSPNGIAGLAGGCGNGGATGIVMDSYFAGTVQSTGWSTGGIAGGFGGGGSILILKNALSWGSVSSTRTSKGGLTGYSASIESSYFDVDVSTLTPNNDALELSTAQMKSAASFASFSQDVWSFEDGRYPTLKEVDASTRPLRMVVEGSSDTIQEGACRSVDVLAQTFEGAAQAVASARTVSLVGNLLETYASQSDCQAQTSAILSVSLGVGEGQKTIWVRGATSPGYQSTASLFALSGNSIPTAYSVSHSPPDADADGQYDIYDACPSEAGPYWNNYCAAPAQYLVISDSWEYPSANSSGNSLSYLEVNSSSEIVSCSVSNVDGVIVTSASCSCSGTSCSVSYDVGDVSGQSSYFTLNMQNLEGISSSKDAYINVQ
jgi:hypothetical protein